MSDDPETDAGRRTDAPLRISHKRRWSEADDAELRRLIEARQPPAAIAKAVGRTQDAVRGRAGKLGLPVPSPLRPWAKTARRVQPVQDDQDS
jgi:hypothetical protein